MGFFDFATYQWTKGQKNWHLPYNNALAALKDFLGDKGANTSLASYVGAVETDKNTVKTEVQNAREGKTTLLANMQAKSARMDVEHNADGTHMASASAATDFKASGDAPTYISTTQFSVTGDKTAIYVVGRRVKATLASGAVYGTVSASAYGAATTVTIKESVIDNTVSAIAYGLVSPGAAGSVPAHTHVDDKQGGAIPEIAVNTNNIFRLADEMQIQHGGFIGFQNGWADGFEVDDQQGADRANSTGEDRDASGADKYMKGTDPGTNQNADQDYTAEANYETYDYLGTTATIATNTITITAGTFPSNAVGMRFSPENPFNPANSAAIAIYTDSTHIVLVSGHGLTASNSAWTLRSFQIASGVAKLAAAVTGGVTLDQSNTTGTGADPGNVGDGSSLQRGQTFQPGTTGTCPKIELDIWKVGSPTDNVYIEIQTVSGGLPTGTVVTNGTSANVAGSSLPTSEGTYQAFTFSPAPSLTSGTSYAIVVKRSGSQDGSNHYQWARGNDTYANGKSLINQGSWAEIATRDGNFKTYYDSGSTVNVINEYVPIIPAYAHLADPSSWSDVNSLARTETLNSASIFYAYFTNAQSGWGANTELAVFDGSNNQRSIVRNNGGTWQHNSNATFGSTTWTNSAVNTLAGALREAAAISANQMTGSTMAGVADSALNVPTGKAGIVAILYSTNNANNPQVDQTRVNYDSQRAAMDLRSKAYDPGFSPSECYLSARIEHSDADGVGTFHVTRNGGTNWETMSEMAQQGLPLTGNIRLFRGTHVFTTGAAGQDVRCRYVTSQNKNQYVRHWGLLAK